MAPESHVCKHSELYYPPNTNTPQQIQPIYDMPFISILVVAIWNNNHITLLSNCANSVAAAKSSK